MHACDSTHPAAVGLEPLLDIHNLGLDVTPRLQRREGSAPVLESPVLDISIPWVIH